MLNQDYRETLLPMPAESDGASMPALQGAEALAKADKLIECSRLADDKVGIPKTPAEAIEIFDLLKASTVSGSPIDSFKVYAKYNGGTLAHGAVSRGFVGNVDIRRAELELCEALIEKLAIDEGNKKPFAETILQSGIILNALGRSAKAVESIGNAVRIFTDIGEIPSVVIALRQHANVTYADGDLEQATIVAQQARDLVPDFWNNLGGDEAARLRSPEKPGADAAFMCMGAPATLAFLQVEKAIILSKEDNKDAECLALLNSAIANFSDARSYVRKDGAMNVTYHGNIAYRSGVELALFFLDLGLFEKAKESAASSLLVAEEKCNADKKPVRNDFNYNTARLLGSMADLGISRRSGTGNFRDIEVEIAHSIADLKAGNPILKVWRILDRVQMLQEGVPNTYLRRFGTRVNSCDDLVSAPTI